MLAYLLQGLLLGFAAGVQPGPLQAYLILQSLKHGWRRTIVYALVPLMSDLPIIAVVVFILAVIPAGWIVVLRLIGGVFLLYLAWNALQTARRLTDGAETGVPSHHRGLLQAVLINLLNPNPYLFWSTIAGPILLAGWRLTPLNGVVMLAAFYIILIAINAVVILVVSVARRLTTRLRQILIVFSAVGLAAFGVYQMWLGITGLT